jgi:hypothetical protein
MSSSVCPGNSAPEKPWNAALGIDAIDTESNLIAFTV